MKVLTIDIETAPILANVWGIWDQNISIKQIRSDGEVMSFAAKWLGKSQVSFSSIYHNDRRAMLESSRDLLDEADAVVTYNGVKFDLRWLRGEFAREGLAPPSPWVDIDLLKHARQAFMFPSYKLDYVTQALGLSGKLGHTGFQLWTDCMHGDEKTKAKAWALMKRYNVRDVRVTEALYLRMRPYMKGALNVALYSDSKGDQCRCGSTSLIRRGYYYTSTSKFQRLRCNDCGAWSREARSADRVGVRAI